MKIAGNTMLRHLNGQTFSMIRHFYPVEKPRDLPLAGLDLPGLRRTGKTPKAPIDNSLAEEPQAQIVTMTEITTLDTLEIHTNVGGQMQRDPDLQPSGVDTKSLGEEVGRPRGSVLQEVHLAAFITIPVTLILSVERLKELQPLRKRKRWIRPIEAIRRSPMKATLEHGHKQRLYLSR